MYSAELLCFNIDTVMFCSQPAKVWHVRCYIIIVTNLNILAPNKITICGISSFLFA